MTPTPGGVATSIAITGLPELQGVLDRMQQLGERPRPVFDAIGQYGESSTRARFKTGVGPDGVRWKLSKRVQQKGGQTLVLKARLLRSITYQAGPNFAEWGTNLVYGRIHQLGGRINRLAFSMRVRLRTDRGGTLLRRGGEGKGKLLAVFAKDTHKQARESWHEVKAHGITMPARPFLGVNAQDAAEIQELMVDVVASRAEGPRRAG